MRNGTEESGQGLVEYGLILIIIAAIVVCAFVYWPVPYLQARLSKDKNEVQQPATPRLSGEGDIKEIVETGSVVEIFDIETTLTNNCENSTPTEVETQRVRTLEHVVIIEGTGGASLGYIEVIKGSLEVKYGIQNKQAEASSYKIKFSTAANRQAIHTVTWKYTWSIGNAIVRLPDGSEEAYLYKVRTALEPETTSQEVNCEQTIRPASEP